MKQITTKTQVSCKGIGIHSGKEVHLTLKPAPENTGIIFIRTDLNNKKIKVTPKNLINNSRATILRQDNIQIQTPEHLLATCYACEIDNLYIELDNEEIPIMDGSAKDFVDILNKAGIQSQKVGKKILEIKKSTITKDNDKTIIALPNQKFKISYVLDYPQPFIGTQVLTIEINKETFTTDIAPARTYGFYSEYKQLLEMGMAKGANKDNCIIIGEDDYLSELRVKDELIRHKILDLIGDLAILGKEIKGHFIAIKSGHQLNAKLVHHLKEKYD